MVKERSEREVVEKSGKAEERAAAMDLAHTTLNAQISGFDWRVFRVPMPLMALSQEKKEMSQNYMR
jgi:hypothetical protein